MRSRALDLIALHPEFAEPLSLSDRTGTATERKHCARVQRFATWIYLAGFDPRGYGVYLYRLEGNAPIRVMAGCRDMTLTAAAEHWGAVAARKRGPSYMRNAKAIRQLIGIGLRGVIWRGDITKPTKPMEPFL